jgi:hypothetical protein
MASAERTLVKSAPELWQILEDDERMRRWLVELAGMDASAEVRVIARVHERRLAWAGDGPAGIEVSLEEKGWGTQVRLSSEAARVEIEALERALDELGTAQRRPFSRPT